MTARVAKQSGVQSHALLGAVLGESVRSLRHRLDVLRCRKHVRASVDRATGRDVDDTRMGQACSLEHRDRVLDVGARIERRLLIAVGTAIAGRPPRRSQRARLTHWAPALGSGVKARGWPGMMDVDVG